MKLKRVIRIATFFGLLGTAAPTAFAAALSPRDPAQNAALEYWKAEAFPKFWDDKGTFQDTYQLLSRAEDGNFSGIAEKFFQSSDTYFEHLRVGTSLPYCDWGLRIWPGDLVHLSACKSLSSLAAARFRYFVRIGNDDVAVRDWKAAMKFCQDIDRGSSLIGEMVQIGCEAKLIKAAAAELQTIKPAKVREIGEFIDQSLLPYPNEMPDAYRKDFEFLIDHFRTAMAKALAGQDIERLRKEVKDATGWETSTWSERDIRDSVQALEPQVERVAILLRVPDAVEFERKLAQLKSGADNLPRVAPPEHVYSAHKRAEIRLAMLRAAIAMTLEGKEALKRFPEPGNSLPFTIRPQFREVIDLQSNYRDVHQQPVTLTIGKLLSLHASAAKGDLELVRHFLNKPNNLDLRDDDGWTPLHHAAQAGKLEVVKLLLERGANVNVLTGAATGENLASERAKRYGLIPESTLPSMPTARGKTALNLASEAGHEDVANFLRSHGGLRSPAGGRK